MIAAGTTTTADIARSLKGNLAMSLAQQSLAAMIFYTPKCGR
jgi:hypothetical protein